MNWQRKLLGQDILNLYHLCQAILANLIYGFPSRKLHVIGVTGTDGKTTTVNFIAKVLQEAGFRTSYLSTINAQIGDRIFDTGLHTTTPSPFLLQKLLKKMVSAGTKYVVLEVTSHALDQFRTWGINFETAVLTNVTAEHLDYHQTFENYVAAKMKLFQEAKNWVVSENSPPIPSLIKEGKGEFITYGIDNTANIWADNIREELTQTVFTAHTATGEFKVELNLPGRFNVLNALAAICVGQIYQITWEKIQAGLEKIKSIAGRMEYIKEGQEFLVMVDFAHTPNALHKLLSFVRLNILGRLILVFGCAGERDPFKRPEMGKVADELADLIILTREDNRSESVEKICNDIASGIRQKAHDRGLSVIVDRREAIRFALSKAQKNDIVIVTGKGHEQSLNIDGREVPWNDGKVMREELEKLVSSKFLSLDGRGLR